LSKWVTFYRGLLCGDKDFKVHKDKQTAERFYKSQVHYYMRIRPQQKIRLPICMSIWSGSFIGISAIRFKKDYGDKYEIINDEVVRRVES